MTTIACDLKSMAGDGRATQAGMITDERARKVSKLRDGRIVGFAGTAAHGIAFRQWLIDGGKFPKIASFSALVLEPSGKLWFYDGNEIPLPCLEPQAIGTGAPHALTAMDCGLSPADAVRMAIRRDSSSGGRVVSIALGD